MKTKARKAIAQPASAVPFFIVLPAIVSKQDAPDPYLEEVIGAVSGQPRPQLVNPSIRNETTQAIKQIISKSDVRDMVFFGIDLHFVFAWSLFEAFHGKRDTFERDVIIGCL